MDFWEKFDSTFLLAIIILIGGFILLGLGIDGEVKGMMGTVIGFFFGRKLATPPAEKEA